MTQAGQAAGLDDKDGPAAATPVSFVAALIDTCETTPLQRMACSHIHVSRNGASQLTKSCGQPPALLRHGNASTAADPRRWLIVCVIVVQMADPQPHQPQ